MKLDKLPYEPSALVEFYTEGLHALGAGYSVRKRDLSGNVRIADHTHS